MTKIWKSEVASPMGFSDQFQGVADGAVISVFRLLAQWDALLTGIGLLVLFSALSASPGACCSCSSHPGLNALLFLFRNGIPFPGGSSVLSMY